MNLKEILAITGQPGLFRFVSQGRGGIIVESLVDKKRSSVAATAKVSALSDVAIFTDKEEEVPLHVVLLSIRAKQNSLAAIDSKKATESELKDYFAGILPDYDRERVYLSDIRKVILWYNILQQNNMLDFELPTEESAEGEAATPAAEKSAGKSLAPKIKQQPTPKASTKAAGSVKINAPRKAQ